MTDKNTNFFFLPIKFAKETGLFFLRSLSKEPLRKSALVHHSQRCKTQTSISQLCVLLKTPLSVVLSHSTLPRPFASLTVSVFYQPRST